MRTVDARAFATDLRRIVHELDPARAIFGLRPVQDVLDAALDQPRLDAAMLGFFAGAAVTLAAIGLYSLFMLVVSERAREMAVRLAIGAAPRQLIGLVMSGAGRLLAGGIVLGIVLTAAADRVLRGVVFGVSPLDIRALAAAAADIGARVARRRRRPRAQGRADRADRGAARGLTPLVGSRGSRVLMVLVVQFQG